MELILNILQTATPIGAIVLSLVIILLLVKSKKSVTDLKENHLSCMPEINETLKRIENKLEVIGDNITYIKAKIKH